RQLEPIASSRSEAPPGQPDQRQERQHILGGDDGPVRGRRLPALGQENWGHTDADMNSGVTRDGEFGHAVKEQEERDGDRDQRPSNAQAVTRDQGHKQDGRQGKKYQIGASRGGRGQQLEPVRPGRAFFQKAQHFAGHHQNAKGNEHRGGGGKGRQDTEYGPGHARRDAAQGVLLQHGGGQLTVLAKKS